MTQEIRHLGSRHASARASMRLAIQFSVNNSPFAGREGQYVTSRNIRERLMLFFDDEARYG